MSFQDRAHIYDGVAITASLTLSEREPGEGGVWYNTTWFEWIAQVTKTITISAVTITYWTDPIGISVWGQSDTGIDDLSSIVLLGQSPSADFGGAITFTATAGATYFVQVGSWVSTPLYDYRLTYPVGRPPGMLGDPGTGDLPVLTGTVQADVTSSIVEGVGFGPASETLTSILKLLGIDAHSAAKSALTGDVMRNSDGSPAYSYERWFRVRIDPPFGAITNLRMWFENYTPNTGWDLFYGTTADYQLPTTVASTIAIYPVPTADPRQGNLDAGILTGVGTQSSPWVVLQASWLPGSTGPITASPLTAHFAWTTC